MNDLWLQIKFWTKTTLIAVVSIYAIFFIYNNTGVDRQTSFWYWFGHIPQTSVFVLAFVSFVAGCLSTLLLRTTLKTIGQFRAVRKSKAERDLAEMREKAARLQTRPTATTSVADVEAP